MPAIPAAGGQIRSFSGARLHGKGKTANEKEMKRDKRKMKEEKERYMEIRGKTEGREEKTQQKKEGKGWTGPAEVERKATFPKIRKGE